VRKIPYLIRYRRKRRHRYDADIEKTDITSYANSDVMVAGEAVNVMQDASEDRIGAMLHDGDRVGGWRWYRRKRCDILSAQSAGWKHFAFYLDRYQPGDRLCHAVWRSEYRSRTAAFDVYNSNYKESTISH
jgi:hypothetical protein